MTSVNEKDYNVCLRKFVEYSSKDGNLRLRWRQMQHVETSYFQIFHTNKSNNVRNLPSLLCFAYNQLYLFYAAIS